MKANFFSGRFLLGILYICIVIAIFAAGFFATSQKSKNGAKVVIDGVEVSVAVADTTALQERGLSGRKSLGENEGMLFIFPQPAQVGFWMKDMLFPIDIIWFDGSRHIIDVWEGAQPESYPEVRASRSSAQYVLEVQSGFYKKHNLKPGDVLELGGVAGYNR